MTEMAQSQVTESHDRLTQGDLAARRAGAQGVAEVKAAQDAAATARKIG